MRGTVLHRVVVPMQNAAIVRRLLGSAKLIELSHKLIVSQLRDSHERGERIRFVLSLCEQEKRHLADLHELRHEMTQRCEWTRADRRAMDRQIAACQGRIARLTSAFAAQFRKR